jgi:hypothetical protein
MRIAQRAPLAEAVPPKLYGGRKRGPARHPGAGRHGRRRRARFSQSRDGRYGGRGTLSVRLLARALVGMEQKALAEASGVSLPTIQRMEASNGTVRGVIESLTRVMAALEAAGVEFINEGATSSGGGRGVRLRRHPE